MFKNIFDVITSMSFKPHDIQQLQSVGDTLYSVRTKLPVVLGWIYPKHFNKPYDVS